MTFRIIPRLDIKGPDLVKGIHLEGLRVLGQPEQFARHYYEQGADELLYMDVVASLYQRNSLLDLVSKTAVGGGLRTIDDIREALRAGADKVSLNTAAINSPELIRAASQKFGSSTITVSIEAIRKSDGKYEAYTDNGRERTGLDALEWAVRAAELGAGELMITSIGQEGTGKGFDLELTREVSQSVPIPVVACGGAGHLNDIKEVATQGQADAVCVASMLHYKYIKNHGQAGSVPAQGNVEYLKSGRGFSQVQPATLGEVKQHLAAQGIPCRPTPLRTAVV